MCFSIKKYVVSLFKLGFAREMFKETALITDVSADISALCRGRHVGR